jgi:hypothetical protein
MHFRKAVDGAGIDVDSTTRVDLHNDECRCFTIIACSF